MNPRQGAERLLFALILIIFGAAVRGGEKKFPLEIAVSFSPVICGDRVHLFAAGGRNQTLDPAEDAPSCNLMSLKPAVQPVCVNGKVFVADSSGALYQMADGIPEETARMEGKPVGIFELDGQAAVVEENRMLFPGSGHFPLPFHAVSAFRTGPGLLVFGEMEALLFSGGRIVLRFPFKGKTVVAACVAGDRIAVGTDDALVLLDSATGKAKKRFITRSKVVSIIDSGEGFAFASTDHMIRLMNLKGRILWQTRIQGRPLGLWTHSNGLLTATAGGSHLVFLEESKGTELWDYRLERGEMIIAPGFSPTKAAMLSFDSLPEPALILVDLP